LVPFLLATAFAGSNQYDPIFRKYSKRFFGVGFDWRIFKAQAMAESRLDPSATSGVGAIGLMQLMPSTFQEVQSRYPELQTIDDPTWNIAAGIYYDRQLWKAFTEPASTPDRLYFTFAGYNAGRGTILKAMERARAENLDERTWPSIETIAPKVPKWQYRQTL